MSLLFTVFLGAIERDVANVRRRAGELLVLSEAYGYFEYAAMAGILDGWTKAHDGNPDAGVEQMVEAIAAHAATGAGMLRHFFLTLLAEAQFLAGRVDDALATVIDGLAVVEKAGERFYEADLHLLHSRLTKVVAPERPEAAAVALARAVAVARSQGRPPPATSD